MSVQQFVSANPVLVIVALFVVGIIAILSFRILLSSGGCLIRLGCAIFLIVGIFLLVRFLFFHF